MTPAETKLFERTLEFLQKISVAPWHKAEQFVLTDDIRRALATNNAENQAKTST